ncbi:hypothetical protein P170DRAFT_112501 [Aspergillus steynii IBT 23096]|uniref:Uncharacterized protein n=1 Tax=Aspergillus steynii IBT 23096 TaxID=1392250 RepID=A0A2I2GIT8_9EURO|nr:uncharacterized protein P170DRAFT_112501 [Aspergillus steynii IBT 23096]PLB52791.1 hypothetical protein P170DRAFT_112501 [Aspergillus steynii IBT 23096]
MEGFAKEKRKGLTRAYFIQGRESRSTPCCLRSWNVMSKTRRSQDYTQIGLDCPPFQTPCFGAEQTPECDSRRGPMCLMCLKPAERGAINDGAPTEARDEQKPTLMSGLRLSPPVGSLVAPGRQDEPLGSTRSSSTAPLVRPLQPTFLHDCFNSRLSSSSRPGFRNPSVSASHSADDPW